MICVPISSNSRESSALTLPCVPTGMNTGVSIRPCPVVSRPRRALVEASDLRSSNTAEIQPWMGWNEHFISFVESAIPLYRIGSGGGTLIALFASTGIQATARKRMEQPAKKILRDLLIEDNEEDYLLVKRLLSRNRYWSVNLFWASEYDEGLSILMRGTHDVCLLDYKLPSGDGLQLLNEAMDQKCPTPIIMLTGISGDQIDVKALECGAADYLIKGQITVDQVERAIR